MPPLTPDQVADAFRASMPRQRSNFERKRRDFHAKMCSTPMYPAIYLDYLMELVEDEVNERMALAEQGVRNLLDSGWRPVGQNAIQGALIKMFEVKDHRQDPASDLREIAERGNGYIGLPNPGGQQSPALRLGRLHVDAFNASLKRLEAHVVREQPPTGNVFHGPTQFVTGDLNTVNFTNVTGDMDARSILQSTSIVREHLNDFDADDREDVSAHVGIVEEEIGKPEPNQGRMRAAWRAIKKLAGAGANAALTAAIDRGVKSVMGGG